MIIQKLLGVHKPQMRRLVEVIHQSKGLLPQFYWPADLLGAELATAEAIGILEQNEIRAFILYRDLVQAWEISLVACDPDHQRQGWTERLFGGVIAAKSQEKQLWLEVHEENVPAQKLYEKLGFKEVRRRPRYYSDGATAILYSHP